MYKSKMLRTPRKFAVAFTVNDDCNLCLWVQDFRGSPFLNLRLTDFDLQDFIDGLREYDIRWDEN